MSNKIEKLDSKSKVRWMRRAEFQRKKRFQFITINRLNFKPTNLNLNSFLP